MKTIITFLTIIIFTFSISSCVEKEEYETHGEKMSKKLKSLVKEYNNEYESHQAYVKTLSSYKLK